MSGEKTRFALLLGHDEYFSNSSYNVPCANVLQACTVPCW